MMYPKIPSAQHLIALFKAKEIQHIVISPGSRNAPLIIGFASDPYFRTYSVADERSAGFFAMGMAQQFQRPVAVVCTSGSALLNYYPSVAEAFYSQIPMIVVSADRPQNKIDIGDGQTIRQPHALANHTLYNANLTETASESNDLAVCMALDLAALRKGPVHINIPFEEPLYETVLELTACPTVSILDQEETVSDFLNYKEEWQKSTRKLILVGVNHPQSIASDILQKWADDPSVVVMTETTSNLYHSEFVSNIDQLITGLSEDEFESLRPELLITFGGMVVSKRIKAFLRTYKPKAHWHIDPLRAYDTYGCLTHHIKQDPNAFFGSLSDLALPYSPYKAFVESIRVKRAYRAKLFSEQAPYSDYKIYKTIIENLPETLQLQVSNSSTIRYLQLFDLPIGTEVFCNRGTSGIDGSTSTAVGAAVATSKQVVLLTGDISFFYDSNGLWNNYIPDNFKIIVVNNSGGGIFRVLPGHQKNKVFETFFETRHHLNASHLAHMFGFGYFCAQNDLEVQVGIENLFKNQGKCILEILTPTEENDQVLKDYFRFLTEEQ